MQIVLDTVDGTFEHETPHQEDGEHHVGHGGGDPDYLAAGLDALEERDVEHEVDDADAAHHLGVRRPRVEDATAVVDL